MAAPRKNSRTQTQSTARPQARDSSGEDFLKSYVDDDSLVEGEEVELPSGRVVRVKALNREEALSIRESGKKTVAEMEQILLHHGMVDPIMTVNQAARWQKVSPAGDIEQAAQKIATLSGLDIKKIKEDGTEETVKGTKSSVS